MLHYPKGKLEMTQIASRNRSVKTAWALGWALAIGLSAGVTQAQEEEEGWKGKLTAAVTAQSGSVDTFAGSVDGVAERKWEKDLAALRFTGVFGTTRDRNASGNDSQSNSLVQNAQALFGDWKHTFDDRFFWDTGTELSRDTTLDRDVRVAASTGPGYRFWRVDEEADDKHFDVSAGFGYRFEMYDGNTGPVIPPRFNENGTTQHLAEVVAGFEYKNKLFDDKVNYTHTASAGLPVNSVNSYIVRTEALIGVPISDAWSFDTGFFYEYVNDVPDNINPSTFRTTVGLGYNF